MFYVICHVWVLALKFLIVVHIGVGNLEKSMWEGKNTGDLKVMENMKD